MSDRRGSPARTVALIVLGLLVVGGLAGGVLLGTVFGWKALFARAQNPLAARELFDGITKRMEQAQQTPPSDNGYDDLSDLLSKSPDPAVVAPVKDLAALNVGPPDAIVKAMAANPVKTREALDGFEAQALPRVRAALRKPRFVLPLDWRQGFLAQMPNFIMLRALAIALTVRGLDAERQKKAESAVDDYLAAIKLGQRAGTSGAIIHEMISIALIRLGVEPLSRLLSAHVLPTSALRRLVRELPTLVPDRTTFVARTDEEYVLALQSFDLAAQGKLNPMSMSPSGTGGLVERLFGPMFAKRGAAVYQNFYLDCRPQIANLDLAGLSTATDAAWKALGTGMASAFLPDLRRAMAHFVCARAKLQAATVAAALEGWKAEHGRYPAALSDLVPSWLPAVPDDPTTGQPFRYQPDGSLFSTSKAWTDIGLPGTTQLHPWSPPKP